MRANFLKKLIAQGKHFDLGFENTFRMVRRPWCRPPWAAYYVILLVFFSDGNWVHAVSASPNQCVLRLNGLEETLPPIYSPCRSDLAALFTLNSELIALLLVE